MLVPLLKLSGVDFKRVSIIALGVLAILLCAYIHLQNLQYKTAQLVYENPKRTKKIARRREVGAVRIVSRTIERSYGERETIIEETRGPILEIENEVEETRPISIAEALAPARTDRYLLTVGMARLSADFDRKALFAGYGFKNRLDIQAGLLHDGHTTPWVFTTFRF